MTTPLRIMTVCGCGMGSSVILRLNAEKILKELGVPAKVEVSDATSAKGNMRNADLIITNKELANFFKEAPKPVIMLTNFVNTKELREKLQEFLQSRQ